MNLLALIPARGGSKGIPDKNLLRLGGKTLVELAAGVARESGIFHRVVCSTDSQRIADVCGCEVLHRPPGLATDCASMLSVVRHAIDACPCDAVMILQPTSPLRTTEHIQDASKLLRAGAHSVVAVTPVPKRFCPDYLMRLDGDGRLTHHSMKGKTLTRRQDAGEAYERNGTLYLVRSDVVRSGSLYGHKIVPYVMSPEESLTIDDERDWLECQRRFGGDPWTCQRCGHGDWHVQSTYDVKVGVRRRRVCRNCRQGIIRTTEVADVTD